MSVVNVIRARRAEIAAAAIPLVIACFPLLWLAPINRHFHHALSDWDNNLWMIGYTGEYLRRHFSFPMTFNTDQWVGMPNPMFYGSLFFPLAGILSAFLGSALALRLIVVGLFWLQTTQVFRTVKAMEQDSFTAWAIAAVVAFAIYPLTNLYSRSSIPEFVAVSLLTSACCLWLRAWIEGPQRRTWSSASWACLLLALSAGTHSVTALLGGLVFGVLVLAGISGSSDRLRRTKFMTGYTVLYLAALSPWLYIVLTFLKRLSISQASSIGTLVFGDSIDLWWVRLLPIPFDIRPLRADLLSEVSTPYLDAQLNVGLLLIAGYLVFQFFRRVRAGRLQNPRLVAAAALGLGAFIGTFTFSVSATAWKFAPGFLSIIQFSYRLVPYCDLILLILIITLLSALKNFQVEFKGAFRIGLAAAVVLMAQAVLVKFNHAAFIQENKVVAGTAPFGDRTALKNLPASFYNPGDYIIQKGFAGNAPALPAVNFLPGTGVDFGNVPGITLNAAKSFETNVEAFPWNRLVINGRLLPLTEIYLSTHNTLAFGDFGRGPANTVSYAFVPDRIYLLLRYLSGMVLLVWMGTLVITACWRRRFRIMSAQTALSAVVFLLIVAVGNALPLLAPDRSPTPITAASIAAQNDMSAQTNLTAYRMVTYPALVIKLQVQFVPPTGRSLAEPLVVTGDTGASDKIGVLYDADGALRIQIDHSGMPLITSHPVTLSLKQAHVVEVALGYRGISVTIDSTEIIASAAAAHPTTQAQITIARNDLGGTTTAARFSGNVLKSFIGLK